MYLLKNNIIFRNVLVVILLWPILLYSQTNQVQFGKTGFNTMTTLINGYITKQISSLSTGMVKARQPGTRSLG